MGYRSEVYLKTTTEGWIIMKKFNDSIENRDYQPLDGAEVNKTESGFYKITFCDVKWYDSFPSVQNFNQVLNMYDEQEIPYSFIRLGEELDDIENRKNWTDDMPSEIECFEPVVDINDDDCTEYESVPLDED